MALTTRRRALTTLGAALAGTVALPAGTALAGERPHGPRPLWRAHAHNDYEHPRPSSTPSTTASAASRPTSSSSTAGSSSPTTRGPRPLPHPGGPLPRTARRPRPRPPRLRLPRPPPPLQLLIDLKTEGASTYLELDRQLRRYGRLFTRYANGRVVPAPSRP